MASYKFYYFNAKGYGELCRWIFAEAGQEYEDIRWEGEDWPKYKTQSPTGQGPWVEVDGQKIAQSSAAARFLARRFGLAGKDEFESARIDMVVGCVYDYYSALDEIFTAPDDQKAAVIQKIAETKVPVFMDRFESLFAQNSKDSKEFVVGSKVSWGDLCLAYAFDLTTEFGLSACLDARPKLKEFRERIKSRPNIAAWLKKRPETKH